MPAHKKRRQASKKGYSLKRKYVIFLFIIIAALSGFFLIFRTSIWNKKEKLSLVIRNKESLSIFVFDPVVKEIIKINIPANTEIEVAGGLGRWKAKSLWDLGVQEGLGGKLAARSMIVGLNLPVYSWADSGAIGLIEPGLKPSITALFSSYESNLSFGDKLKLLFFSMKINNTKRVEYNLGETAYLQKKGLPDGTEGYVVTRTPSQSIAAIFSEPSYSQDAVRVSVIDVNDSVNTRKIVGVIEVLGGKVSSLESASSYDGVCIIKSKSEELLDIILKLFTCEEYSIDEDQSYDLEIILGEKFSGEY